jgi:hypothetical protein
MDLNICTLVGLRYHIFSTHPSYPYKLFPWAGHSGKGEGGGEGGGKGNGNGGCGDCTCLDLDHEWILIAHLY